MAIQSKTIETIDFMDRAVGVGSIFHAWRSTSAIGASSWIDLQVTPTSTSVYINLREITVNHSAGIFRFEILECNGSSMATGTTAMTSYNRNRNSTKAATAVLYSNPTYVASSVVSVYTLECGGSGLDTVANRNMLDDNRIILKASSTYILRLTDLTATSGYSFFGVKWSEE